MRKYLVLGLLAATVAGCAEMPIDGLSRSGWDQPSTMPPANYTKDMWVDSRGCVFFATRSGWAPFVGKNLKQVCR